MLTSPLELWHGRIVFEKKTSVLIQKFTIRFSEAQLSAPVYIQCMSYSTFCILEIHSQQYYQSRTIQLCIMKPLTLWHLLFCLIVLEIRFSNYQRFVESKSSASCALFIWQSRKVSWNAKEAQADYYIEFKAITTDKLAPFNIYA